jgi:hypothetical protein
MHWLVRRSALPLVLGAVLGGCGDRNADPNTGFSYEPPGTPAPTTLLRADTVAAGGGHRWLDFDVLMPSLNIRSAEATLQKVIDSLAAADTLAIAVRVTGFVMGLVDVGSQSADLEPALRGVWGPPDSSWAVGSGRRTYRTYFTVLRPFDGLPGPAGQ